MFENNNFYPLFGRFFDHIILNDSYFDSFQEQNPSKVFTTNRIALNKMANEEINNQRDFQYIYYILFKKKEIVVGDNYLPPGDFNNLTDLSEIQINQESQNETQNKPENTENNDTKNESQSQPDPTTTTSNPNTDSSHPPSFSPQTEEIEIRTEANIQLETELIYKNKSDLISSHKTKNFIRFYYGKNPECPKCYKNSHSSNIDPRANDTSSIMPEDNSKDFVKQNLIIFSIFLVFMLVSFIYLNYLLCKKDRERRIPDVEQYPSNEEENIRNLSGQE